MSKWSNQVSVEEMQVSIKSKLKTNPTFKLRTKTLCNQERMETTKTAGWEPPDSLAALAEVSRHSEP